MNTKLAWYCDERGLMELDGKSVGAPDSVPMYLKMIEPALITNFEVKSKILVPKDSKKKKIKKPTK